MRLWLIGMTVAATALFAAEVRAGSQRPLPGPTIVVEVVDGRGQPAVGVSVSLKMHRAGMGTRLWSGAESVVAGVTDPQGRTSLDLESWKVYSDAAEPPNYLRYPPRYALDGAAVALEIPAAPPVSAAVDFRLPPKAPIRLVLPDCGTLHVDVRDDRGNPVASGAELVVAISGDVGLESHSVRIPVSDGVARLPHVPLGAPLQLSSRSDIWEAATPLQVAGPGRVGEALRAELVLGPLRPVITGRLMGGAGEGARPAGGEMLGVRIAAGSTEMRTTSRTDSEGRFRIPILDQLPTTGEVTLELWLEKPIWGIQPWVPPSRRARAQLPLPLQAGEQDIGTAALAPEPIIVSGSVVRGASGQPAALAEVTLTVHTAGEPHPWLYTLSTDAAGRFALHGVVADGEVEIAVSHQGLQASLRVRPGTQDLVVEL